MKAFFEEIVWNREIYWSENFPNEWKLQEPSQSFSTFSHFRKFPYTLKVSFLFKKFY